jgi:protein phosphatase
MGTRIATSCAKERGITLLAVADGVGGSSGGEIAADAALVELGARFFGAPSDRATSDALAEAMRDANACGVESSRGIGTPRRRDHDRCGCAARGSGDHRQSRRQPGVPDPRRCVPATHGDHSGDMEHAITRFAGDPRGIQPDLFVETLRPDDRLLLCSDGLTRHVSPEEIAKATGGEDVRVAANALVDLANARGGQDNITVVLHQLGRPATIASAAGRAAAFLVFALLILVTVGGAIAVLFAASSVPPSTSARPSASATATPTESSSPSPSPTASPTRRQARALRPSNSLLGSCERGCRGFSPCDDQGFSPAMTKANRSRNRRAAGAPIATATAPTKTAPSMSQAPITVACANGFALTGVGHESVG